VLTASQLSRLSALQNRATRYEIVAEIRGTRYLLGYARLSSRSRLLEMARPHGAALAAAAGVSDETPATYTAARGWEFGPTLRVFRTHRTERDCIMEGETPRMVAP
jgi:hypothetical protein